MKNHERLLLMALVVITIITSGCTSQARTPDPQNVAGMSCADDTCSLDSAKTANAKVEKLEIYHFHGTHQCASCIAVGQLAEETVNTYFADELKSGKIVFGHINGELPENRDLVVKYSATGSSLWLGTYDANGFHKEENVNVWYKINDKQDYMQYLKGVIEQKLRGD